MIERIADGSQFVWVPVGFLPANGTIDGKKFDVQFGRRNYLNDKFNEKGGYYEPKTFELSLQNSSVKKYGGFYISRYYISENKRTGKMQSIKDEWSLTRNDYNQAFNRASSFERSDSVKSHLLFGAEYDSVLEWFIASNAKTLQEIVGVTKFEERFVSDYLKKENCEKHSTNNIYDFDLFRVWTQERVHEYFEPELCKTARGSFFSSAPVAKRIALWDNSPEVDSDYYSCIAIRVALCID